MANSLSVENNFTKGLISQTTGLNFPENACVSTSNCVFRPWGLVERRPWLDAEAGSVNTSINMANTSFNRFVWKDVLGNGNLDILCLQIGSFVFFYNMSLFPAVSPGLISSITMVTFGGGASSTQIAQTQCQFATGNGFLFIFNQYTYPVYCSYNAGSNVVVPFQSDIQIRDFEGIDDLYVSGTLDNNRPAALTVDHTYNLYNQGWNSTTVGQFLAAANVYPSNNDIPWLFNIDNTQRTFVQSAVNAALMASGKAPRGHFILSAFQQDRNAASGLGVTYPVGYPGFFGNTFSGSGINRCSTGTFWQGRVWYAGIKVQGLNNKLFFSQIVTGPSNFGKCYQKNDPTNSDLFDILPDDGGVIVIQEIGTVYKLFPYQNALFIFANNGVWAITGSSGVGLGFTANDYTVHKIASVPSISANSFVDVYGLPVWWNLTGIYTLSPGQGGFTVQSLSDDSIFNFFEGIPTVSKVNAMGAFDPVFGIIQWTYRSTGETGINQVQHFDSILNYNTRSKAFYPWSFNIANDALPFLIGVFYDEETVPQVTPRFKYIVVSSYNAGTGNGNVTFADQYTPQSPQAVFIPFTDWYGLGFATDYTSSFATGYKVHGQLDKRWQVLYLTVYFENQDTSQVEPRTIETSCFLQSIWDYATSLITNQFSAPQALVVINDQHAHVARKIKLRGRGRVVQLNFTSVTQQPMNIEGWAMTEVINTKP